MRGHTLIVTKKGWMACLVILYLLATVLPVWADECDDAKRALAIAEEDLQLKKKLWNEATKKVNETFPKTRKALQVFNDAWGEKEKAWAIVKNAQAVMQNTWGKNRLLRKIPLTNANIAWKAAVNAVEKALEDYRAASKASEEAYKAYKVANAESEKALENYLKAAADVGAQYNVIRLAKKRVEEACAPAELKKLLEGTKTGKVRVAPGGKGGVDKGAEGDDEYRKEHGLDKKITDLEDDSEYRKLIGEDKDDSKNDPRDGDSYLEKLFDDFGMNDGSDVVKEYTGRANEANTEDIAIEEARRRGLEDDDDGGGGGLTTGGGGGVAMTNATFSAQCDVNAGVGTNTLSANGASFCTTSTLAGGTANITCAPGSTVTISATCTATTCRAFVNSFTNLTCPFAAPGFITGGFGGAGGFGTNASISCTCQ